MFLTLSKNIGEWLSGIALAWGARGPEFDSRLPDHFFKTCL